MTALQDQAALQLAQGMQALAREVALSTRVARAALPQWLTDAKLRERYAVDGRELRALLAHHRIPSRPNGRGLRVHIDDVLRLDELVRTGAAPAPSKGAA